MLFIIALCTSPSRLIEVEKEKFEITAYKLKMTLEQFLLPHAPCFFVVFTPRSVQENKDYSSPKSTEYDTEFSLGLLGISVSTF